MQYMVSGSMLIMPVPDGGDSAKCYLPQGLWTNFFTGREYEGGGWIEGQVSCKSMPLMIRENSIVAVTGQDGGRNSVCELRVYAIRDSMKLDMDIYGMDGGSELSVCVKRKGRTVTLTADGQKPYTLRMVNMRADSAVNGFLAIDGNDSIITPDSGASVIEINF